MCHACIAVLFCTVCVCTIRVSTVQYSTVQYSEVSNNSCSFYSSPLDVFVGRPLPHTYCSVLCFALHCFALLCITPISMMNKLWHVKQCSGQKNSESRSRITLHRTIGLNKHCSQIKSILKCLFDYQERFIWLGYYTPRCS